MQICELLNMRSVTRIMLFAYVYHATKLLNLTVYYVAYQ